MTHFGENLYHFPVVCNQCENAYCANVCPTGAINRDEETGALEIDREKCVGCGLCGRYCPIDMAKVDPDLKKTVKCDLCGGDPLCVKVCPTGALEVVFANVETKGETSEEETSEEETSEEETSEEETSEEETSDAKNG